MIRIFFIFILTFYVEISTSIPTSSTGPIEHIKVHNKSEETAKQETQNLESKQLLGEDEDAGYDYPVVTKKEVESDSGHLNVEHLRQKCLHLSKLLNLNKSPNKPSNYEYEQYQEDYRPIYVTTQKPTIKTTYPSFTKPSSFYVTVPPVNRISVPAASAIKYIRLEPVILQKTILSNGRTVYYWHKSLPTAVEYPEKNDNVGRDEPSYQGNYNYGYNPFYNYYNSLNYYVPPHNYYSPFYQNVVPVKPMETTTEQSTTTSTTTEDTSFGLGLSHFIPFYGSSGESTTTTTEIPSTTPPKQEDLYNQQLKYVMPFSYDDNLRHTWAYNPYNYNYVPQVIPQTSNNYRVPYGSPLQIVKAVVVPKVEAKSDDKIDDLSN